MGDIQYRVIGAIERQRGHLEMQHFAGWTREQRHAGITSAREILGRFGVDLNDERDRAAVVTVIEALTTPEMTEDGRIAVMRWFSAAAIAAHDDARRRGD